MTVSVNQLVANDLADLTDLPMELTIVSASLSIKPGGKICCGCQCMCDESRGYCCCCAQQ